ncbi:hypothetical protein CRG98_030940 [Punica granatum]|uniref:Protein kinase domain-containing protein n=1 Tax=Punica granatum TaxID=22663 RepID=A0A2I0IY15_PUNGR|nr:hypothetical protein CRG98_030940 [Punica granatum]
MIISSPPVPIFVAVLVTLQVVIAIAHAIPANCSRTCSGHDGRPSPSIQYPFGFSPGCPIQLNCTPDGNASIGGFPVLAITSDTITVTIVAQCDRPISIVQRLYGPHFAPTSKNAILLNNCSSRSSVACPLPSAMARTHFESICAGGTNSSMSCYSEQGRNSTAEFIDLKGLRGLKCQYLLSGILAESISNDSMSLDVQMIQLGWWLDGDCKCDKKAACRNISAPDKRRGFRCRCRDGYVGDGFADGIGCHKGLVVGAFIMISLGLICCVLRRRRRMRSLYSTKRRLTEVTGGCTIPIYPYKEIERATNHFSEKHRLGNGAYGTVYAGKLHGEEWVAIKRIRHRDMDSIEQVMNEIRLLSSVSHPHLVRLLGCSIEQGEQILMYEFMPNGTLREHLQRERGDGLPWPARLKIAMETAQAIAHLHSAEPPIYHRDIKSSNILLDYDFKSKVADFGLSRLGMPENSHISTAPQGTPGYLDPQYHQNFHLSDKSDVYSFGVVLVEIITSLKVIDFTRHQDEVNLAALAIDRIARGLMDEIIDPLLEPNKDAWTLSSIRKVAELAFRCLAFQQDMRPLMVEVAAELDQIRLSRWSPSEAVNNCRTSSEVSSSCSSSTSRKPLSGTMNSTEQQSNDKATPKTRVGSINSVESIAVTENSPDSVHDSWLSEESSPSSNSLLNSVIQ